jgi:hypothetical protein
VIPPEGFTASTYPGMAAEPGIVIFETTRLFTLDMLALD